MQEVLIIAAASACVLMCVRLSYIINCFLSFFTTPRTFARDSFGILRGN